MYNAKARFVVLTASAACCAAVAMAQGIDDKNGQFQLEGDAKGTSPICFKPSTGTGSGATNPGLVVPVPAGGCPSGYNQVSFGTPNDWGSIGTPLAKTTIPLSDATNSQSDNSFTGGSSKDIYDVSQWAWKGAKASQSKDDIAHAFAAAYQRPSDKHVILVVGLDRYDNSGNATAGFWLLKDKTVKTNNNSGGGADGHFDGQHRNGDLLIVSDFTTGGAVSNIAAYKWVGNGTSGSLQPLGGGVTGGNATCNPASGATTEFCGISNPVTVDSPWSFTDKAGSGSFRQGEFLEIAIDLNHPNIFGDSAACFSTFLAETRASSSTSATLSDFAGPAQFNLCEIGVTKACGASSLSADKTKVQYPFSGSVLNTGIGTLYNPIVSEESLPTGCTLDITGITQPTVASIPAGGSATYSGSMTCNGILGTNDINKVSVTACSSDGCPDGHDVGVGFGQWSDPSSCAPPIVSQLKLFKNCESCLVSNASGLLVNVGSNFKVCNDGTSTTTINNVSVKDCRGTVSGQQGQQVCCIGGICNSTNFTSITLDATSLAPGACAKGTSQYAPSSGPNCSGSGPACSFSNYAIASGTAVLGGASVFANGGTPLQATCSLCELGDCMPPEL